MINPYDSPDGVSPLNVTRHPVRRYCISALLIFCLGVLIAAPGCYLLNQDWQVVPTSTFIGGFNVNGTPIPTSTVLWLSLVVGGALLIAAACLAGVGYNGMRKNHAGKHVSKDGG